MPLEWIGPTVAVANPYQSGGTDVAVADGGTGASTKAGARTNLGLLSSRVSVQFDKANDTLANVTGLSLTVLSGVTYAFEAILYVVATVGGSKFAIGGTATATSIVADGFSVNEDATSFAKLRVTALGAAITGLFDPVPLTRITGTITVDVGGTLTVQFAQSTTDVTVSSVLVGSTFVAQEIA